MINPFVPLVEFGKVFIELLSALRSVAQDGSCQRLDLRHILRPRGRLLDLHIVSKFKLVCDLKEVDEKLTTPQDLGLQDVVQELLVIHLFLL